MQIGNVFDQERNETKTWVDLLGFEFDPFKYLNAADDPHLGEYIVDLDKFTGAWKNQPALIFAPAGGGKTTMRIYTYRTCWVGRDGLHPFPVQYYLPLINDRVDWTDSIEKDLERAVAYALLLSLSFRPERLKNLSHPLQKMVADFLSKNIGRDPLLFHLSVLEQQLNPIALAELVDRTYILPDPPQSDAVQYFCSILSSYLSQKESEKQTTSGETIDQIGNLIINDLQFESIYLLIDGIDGFADSANDPQKASEQINGLLKKTRDWSRKGIYIKLFLPEETEPLIRSKLWRSYINWTPHSLARVVKQRIHVASRGKFGSLNAVSGPGLRNEYIEQILAQHVIPLPREIIFITQQLFEAYERRSKGTGKIESEDLETALESYKEDIKRRHMYILPQPFTWHK